MMDIGFDTIGNATVIAYDRGPVLATDPWVQGHAYFGSWTLAHAIPEEQRAALGQARYVWLSHGHPDHLNADSIACFRDATVLLPDHVGGRIAADLAGHGFTVRVLKDREWVKLSPRIAISCVADYNQDGILLIDVGGRLIVNLNDASDHGWRGYVKTVIKRYERSFLLMLAGYGDANMINFFAESGERIPPATDRSIPIGFSLGLSTRQFGTTHAIPFSSLHKYQRRDSVWANAYAASLEDYERGFDNPEATLLPAYIRYDCATDRYLRLNPPPTASEVFEPEAFGDNWHDPLDQDDVIGAKRYFQSIAHLSTCLDYINVRVGGRDYPIDLAPRRFKRGITFEAPRASLMTAIGYGVFDDLLIGNFMKTTLHGAWPVSRLHPDFTPYVAKYADNGGARSAEELRAYFAEYRRRTGSLAYFRHLLLDQTEQIFRNFVPRQSGLFRAARKAYWVMTGGRSGGAKRDEEVRRLSAS